MGLEVIPEYIWSAENLSRAWNAVIDPWDGSKETFETYAASVERFVNRNKPILSNRIVISLIVQSSPLEMLPRDENFGSYQQVLDYIRSRTIDDQTLSARKQFWELEPTGNKDPIDASAIRYTLGQHHQLFFKSHLPDFEGYNRLKNFLPQELCQDIGNRLWEHKNPVSYNFVRDLALNLLKNEPQQKLHGAGSGSGNVRIGNPGAGKLDNTASAFREPEQFTLLPHNPPYHALDLPPRRDNETKSCYENRKRQLIESRERKGVCGYCTQRGHGYFGCKMKQTYWQNLNSLGKRNTNVEDNFYPMMKKSRAV